MPRRSSSRSIKAVFRGEDGVAPVWGPRERTFQQPSASEAVAGWRPGRAFTREPSRAAAAILRGPRSGSGLNRFLLLFTFVMDDAERQGRLWWGQMLAQDKCPPLGLPTSYPAECQSMTTECQSMIRAGCPQWPSYFLCLVISAQKQLKSASAGRNPRTSLAGARTEAATNPCCQASIEDRLANLPTCDYFSQTFILWPVWHGWPCWELALPPA